MTSLLEIDDVFVRFPFRQGFWGSLGFDSGRHIDAVAGVSLSVKEGETYGIVGESGSGKTTLGRAVAGLVKVSEGSIRYRGEELARLSESAFRPYRREILMNFQDPVGSLSPRMTIGNLIAEPYRIHGIKDRNPEAEAQRLLSLVGLPPDFVNRYPYQLSGGQARRVGVARSLALNPKLLIADEPTAGLDVSIQGELLNLLAKLQDEFGMAIVIISHNLNVVRHVADRVGIMYLGRVVEEGPTEKVFADPQHPYTLALLAANPEPDPDARLARIELRGEPPSLIDRPGGCEFHPRCPFAQPRCAAEAAPWTAAETGHHRCHFPGSRPARSAA